MAKIEEIGTCTNCGEENVEVTAVDEVTFLCEDCLDELDYRECDECHEFWNQNYIEVKQINDGRWLCEYCIEALLEDGEITEEDILD